MALLDFLEDFGTGVWWMITLAVVAAPVFGIVYLAVHYDSLWYLLLSILAGGWTWAGAIGKRVWEINYND